MFKFWCGSNFRRFNFRSAIGDRKLNPVENNRLYGNRYRASVLDEQTGDHVHELWFTTLDLVSFASEGLFVIAQIVQGASKR